VKLKIVSYNIRTLFSHPIDGTNSFIHRAGMILEKIETEKPHVICIQEVSDGIRRFLDTYLNGYTLVGFGRLADYTGEGLCIAFRKDCVDLLSLEHFWLSLTPYTPGSRYEIQSQYPRICQMVTVKHKNVATPIRLYNVHLDHESDEARILGIKQILDHAIAENEKSPFPVMIMGDFNAYVESETIRFCKQNEKMTLIDLSENSGSTFHNFGNSENGNDAIGKKIDYIFADNDTAKREYTITKWEDSQNGIYLSDHYPLCCEIDF
jgi:endonuclease/exonuclease/phosphatase family metal-dependent hydrolase